MEEYKKRALNKEESNTTIESSKISVDNANEAVISTDLEVRLNAKINALEQNYVKSNASLEVSFFYGNLNINC